MYVLVYAVTHCIVQLTYIKHWGQNPKKMYLNLYYTQKIFKFFFTLPLESSITFLNLVLAVLKWAIGRFKNGNRRLYKESRAKLKYAP